MKTLTILALIYLSEIVQGICWPAAYKSAFLSTLLYASFPTWDEMGNEIPRWRVWLSYFKKSGKSTEIPPGART